ncbi:hypothetical protein [Nocardiopsis sp. NPDC006938]|uniref:hypothetical protein n=1 Tax=Nocardiopsis sp. NPDC006938 TaxID=3364337 RepID=UPI0036A62CA5
MSNNPALAVVRVLMLAFSIIAASVGSYFGYQSQRAESNRLDVIDETNKSPEKEMFQKSEDALVLHNVAKGTCETLVNNGLKTVTALQEATKKAEDATKSLESKELDPSNTLFKNLTEKMLGTQETTSKTGEEVQQITQQAPSDPTSKVGPPEAPSETLSTTTERKPEEAQSPRKSNQTTPEM